MSVIHNKIDPDPQLTRAIERLKPLSEWLTDEVLRRRLYEPGGVVIEVIAVTAAMTDEHTASVELRYLVNGAYENERMNLPYSWIHEGSGARQVIRRLLDIQRKAVLDQLMEEEER